MGAHFRHIMPKVVSSTEEFFQEIDSAESNLVVVEYFADWCTKCEKTIHWLEHIEQQYEHVVVLRVDCDTLPKLAQSRKIRAVPTYHMFRKGKVVDRLVGAIKADLYQKTNDHVPRNHSEARQINTLLGEESEEDRAVTDESRCSSQMSTTAGH